MGRLDDRLKRLEAEASEVPWYSLPPGVEPDWPRPLADWSDEELRAFEVVVHAREINEYVSWIHDEAEKPPQPTPEETWVRVEAWHEYRWRFHGIVRRSFGMPTPEDADAVARRWRMRMQAYLEDHPEAGLPREDGGLEGLLDMIESYNREEKV
jgi:hypothetical protein